MSDFYRRRRVVIKDATALATFFLGFVWSGAFVWPFLTSQLDQGDMIRGLAYFLAAVLGTAIVTGAIGLRRATCSAACGSTITSNTEVLLPTTDLRCSRGPVPPA